MTSALPPNGFRSALVLGGGGPVGTVWTVGLLVGLREAGIDLAQADRVVGTSAGAVVAAILADGGDVARLLTPPEPGQEPAPPVPADAAEHVARMDALLAMSHWPDRDLVITSVDAESGDLRAWTRTEAASVAEAVAASTAVPGVFPPIPIDGGHYADGGVRSPINADLAAGAETIVILEPGAHLYPRADTDDELALATTVSVSPDAQAIAATGADVFAPAALRPAYEAGLRQSAVAAARLRAVWLAS
ncbi:patatin-like phospholipase family protein [Nocardia cerradoensis]|uniref:patatin-like phospholipase family protein n=1 Tax=Nocardia cerradoensis TaxID=85688 RepID=UPI0002E07826|nr:patatin-like phospholipase family protein [Nocardia cerradoensis]